jgi:hypothetical protein
MGKNALRIKQSYYREENYSGKADSEIRITEQFPLLIASGRIATA